MSGDPTCGTCGGSGWKRFEPLDRQACTDCYRTSAEVAPASPGSVKDWVHAFVEDLRAHWDDTLDGLSFDEVAPMMRANLAMAFEREGVGLDTLKGVAEPAPPEPYVPNTLLEMWDNVRRAALAISMTQAADMGRAVERLEFWTHGYEGVIKVVATVNQAKVFPADDPRITSGLLQAQWAKLLTMMTEMRRAAPADLTRLLTQAPEAARELNTLMSQVLTPTQAPPTTSSPEFLRWMAHFFNNCTGSGGGWGDFVSDKAEAILADFYAGVHPHESAAEHQEKWENEHGE